MTKTGLIIITMFLFVASAIYISVSGTTSGSVINPLVASADPIATPSATPSVTASPSATPIPAPSVSITAPQNGTVVKRNANVLIGASVSDPTFVQTVQFYVNGALICSDSTNAYSCSFKTSNEKNKNYALGAKAIGTFGSVDSPVVSITAR